MNARRFHMMQPYCEGPMTTAMRRWETRATRGAFMRGLALLLATLGVLATTATPTAAQSLTRGPVLIETHHTDLAGNIRLSTNEAGDVTQRLDYAPFGEVDGRSCTGDGDPTRSPQFQGKLRDPKTCLDDFGARDYYMVTGRFQSVDPVLPVETALRDPQQWNRYAYARNNPLIYTDPDGRSATLIGAVGGGLFAGTVAALRGGTIREVAAAAVGGAVSGAMVGSVIDTGGASLTVLVGTGALAGVGGTLAEDLVNGHATTIAEAAVSAAGGAAGAMAGALVGRAGASYAGRSPRTEPRGLAEKLTLDEAKGGVGKRIMQGKIVDPKYPENIWAKMQHVHEHPDGTRTVIHYWENLQTGAREGFKFK